jgi:hypothetical protein
MDLFLDVTLQPPAFLLKASGEFARSVLEENEKTEGKKKEKDQPKKPSK